MSYSIKIKKRGVNSKQLFTEVSEFVEEGITSIGVRWSSDVHRESFVELVEDWLTEIYETGKITQFNVICDARNNPTFGAEGRFYLTVSYRQKNCLNVTSLEYEITETDGNLDGAIEFFLFP